MPPRDEDMTREEARAIIRDHERKHGHETKHSDRDDDVPTATQRDEPPGWAKRGEPAPDDDD